MPQAKQPEDMVSAMRRALREELGLADGNNFRDMLRDELSSELSWALRNLPAPAAAACASERPTDPDEPCQGAVKASTRHVSDVSPNPETIDRNVDGEDGKPRVVEGAHKHFSDFLKAATGEGVLRRRNSISVFSYLDSESEDGLKRMILARLDRLYFWIAGITEPQRTGHLAQIVMSQVFETMVCIIIFLNCGFMVSAANTAVKDPGNDRNLWTGEAGFEGIFLTFYSVELLLKLVVHRQYFFLNDNWKLNVFDMALVIAGHVDLLIGTNSNGTFFRVLRVVKLGKAIRAVRIMVQLRHLRMFLVCIHGSFTSFFWSLVMLLIVFALFSLFFVQMTAMHLAETDQPVDRNLLISFGSVSRSMLTLYKAATGGDDWAASYSVISQVGESASIVYLGFIAFVQLALINLITGIFVESAMQTLAPDRESVALAHKQKEAEYARDLEHLCKLVDHDLSGKLTREQFEDGMHKGRIPTLLLLLGLSEHHVIQFFRTMSDLASEDKGQVDIRQFVAGCMRLKGAATNFDLQLLHAEVKCVQLAQERAVEILGKQIGQLNASLRQD